jgi:hypothetical protein
MWGGSITGSLDALDDTASGDLEVYAVASAGWHSANLGGL